jgi:SpoIIAA-like
MIEVLPDMPEGVVGIRVSGRLGGEDFRGIRTTLEQAVKAGELRIVEVIASDYAGFGPGGLATDVKLGFGTLLRHYSAFKRFAVVTDKEWVAHTLHALAWMVPGELRLFGLDDLEDAKSWAAGSA